MKKYLLTIIFALIIGFFLGNFLLKQYKDYKSITVMKSGYEFYFFEYGVYSNIKEMEENTINLENYIYRKEQDKYYVYIGLTKDKTNIDKLINYFKKLGYDTHIKTYFIDSDEFNNYMTNLDLIINDTNDETTIGVLITQSLQKYEEVINNGNKN